MRTTTKTEYLRLGIGLPGSLLAVSIGLGLLAERLLFDTEVPGAGLFLWFVAFAAVACALVRYCESLRMVEIASAAILVLAAIALLLFRTTPMVVLTLGLIVVATTGMILLIAGGLQLRDTTVEDHVRFGLRIVPQAALGGFAVFRALDMRACIGSPQLRAGTRGALLALPVLLIFSSLFASADAGFSRFAFNLVDWLSEEALARVMLIFFVAWLSMGLLAGVSLDRRQGQSQSFQLLRLGTADAVSFMGLVVGLFVLFVLFQLNYLFGGSATIESVAGLSVAEYARRGFFELLAVTALSLVFLLLTVNAGANLKVFRPLALALIACVLIILASALQRLALYIDAFGLSIDRLFAAAVLLWLGISLLWFAWTIGRDRLRGFALGLTLSGIVIGFVFCLANPARIVAGVNIDRAVAGSHELDVDYLVELGSDVVPLLVQRVQDLPRLSGCRASRQLLAEWGGLDASAARDWRNWNGSVSRARATVAESRSLLADWAGRCVF